MSVLQVFIGQDFVINRKSQFTEKESEQWSLWEEQNKNNEKTAGKRCTYFRFRFWNFWKVMNKSDISVIKSQFHHCERGE